MGKKSLQSRISLNDDALEDLLMWNKFLICFNGKTLISERKILSSVQNQIFTDASGSGFGGTYKNFWIEGIWPQNWRKLNIAVLELYPIYILVEKYSTDLANSLTIFHCDNEAVTTIINKQTSKDDKIMKILRPLVLTLLLNNIKFKAIHIPGVTNVLPDCISRQKVTPKLLEQHAMDLLPSKIPVYLKPENFEIA